MDGSHTVLGCWLGSEGLPYSNTLSRIICYGEALRAVTDNVSDQLITGPHEPMVDLLDDAYDRFSKSRSTYLPEEFAIFVMSLLLDLCEDAEETSKLKHGAARYILKSAPILPEGYAGIIEGARRILSSSAEAHVVHNDQRARKRARSDGDINVEHNGKPEREFRRDRPTNTPHSSRAQRIHLQGAPTESRPPQRSEPTDSVLERQLMTRTPRQGNFMPRPARQESGILEKAATILLLIAFILYIVFVALGLLDAPSNPIDAAQFG
jgi:hypothetical protein